MQQAGGGGGGGPPSPCYCCCHLPYKNILGGGLFDVCCNPFVSFCPATLSLHTEHASFAPLRPSCSPLLANEWSRVVQYFRPVLISGWRAANGGVRLEASPAHNNGQARWVADGPGTSACDY